MSGHIHYFMESPTRWLHMFIFRHDFEIIRASSYINRVHGIILTFLGNKLMWENAAQMQIVSLNWWQYAGRVWSHANSAQPPNSHLAPKLKINAAHWNNSLHVGGTWYCPSDPYTSSVCARLWRPEDSWHDEAFSWPGFAPFLAELQPTPGGQHCLVQLRWKEGHPCLGSKLTFDPKHAQLGSCLHSELASPWPQHPVGPKGSRVTCCMGRGFALDVHEVTSKHPPSPMATFDSSSGSGCTDAGSWLHPPRSAHSSPHGGLHPIPWLTGNDFHH